MATTNQRTGDALPVGTDIFGPFEAGFGAQQEFILEGLGCDPASDGYVDGGTLL